MDSAFEDVRSAITTKSKPKAADSVQFPAKAVPTTINATNATMTLGSTTASVSKRAQLVHMRWQIMTDTKNVRGVQGTV